MGHRVVYKYQKKSDKSKKAAKNVFATVCWLRKTVSVSIKVAFSSIKAASNLSKYVN